MTRGEKIREYSAEEYCAFVNQDECTSSDCPEGGGLCELCSGYADEQMKKLTDLGAVIGEE